MYCRYIKDEQKAKEYARKYERIEHETEHLIFVDYDGEQAETRLSRAHAWTRPHVYGGQLISDECIERMGFEVCVDCGRVYDPDQEGAWVNDEPRCGECVTYCGYLGECVPNDDMVMIDDTGEWVSHTYLDSVFNDRFYQCPHCYAWVSEGAWNFEQKCCTECEWDTLIGEYHTHDYPNATNAMGFELEVEAHGDKEIDDCICEVDGLTRKMRLNYEHDGSLNSDGAEIISNPIPLDEWDDCKTEMREILASLQGNGCTSHDNGRCGLHLHFSRALLSDESIAKITNLYSANEDFFAKVARRTPEQVEQWAKIKKTSGYNDALDKVDDDSGRYHAINNTNSATVEFRLGRGTLNYQSFMAWVDIHLAIVQNAPYMENESTNLRDWLDTITDATKDYIKARTGLSL